MLMFLIVCALIVVAFPLLVILAYVGFWIIVGLVALAVFVFATIWAIDTLQPEFDNITTPIVGTWDAINIGGLVLWVVCVVFIIMVVFVPKINDKK